MIWLNLDHLLFWQYDIFYRQERLSCDGWMDDLQFYVLFNRISVISGRWVDVNERLCAMEPRLRLRRVRLEWGLNPGLLDQ